MPIPTYFELRAADRDRRRDRVFWTVAALIVLGACAASALRPAPRPADAQQQRRGCP
jgi:hypothetical protein